MCGITGYAGVGDKSVLARMNDTLEHRGPDDAGVQVFPTKKISGSVGLAQRRLSIIDLSPAGHQPMSNEEGTVWVAFNGEVYNFASLRSSLTQKHTFRGGSDTEVILHLYEELGPKVFAELEGMFAIALFDTKTERLYLARDRMGKKPLYWSVQGNTLLFGSELKALMAHPVFKKEIDVSAVNKYFAYEYVPTPHTIFAGTYKLEPGTYLSWDGARAEKERFWKPTFAPKTTMTFEAGLDALDTALLEATRTRLVADVPLGIFLSGGIDSSAIAYYAVKGSAGAVQTFSIGFEDTSFDESAYAQTVARHLGTEHHSHILRERDCLDMVPTLGALLDEPVADASIVPTTLLSRFTREHVTVALGGDGGDELFCGYDTFLAERYVSLYERVPSVLRDAVRRMVGTLPTSHSNMSLDFKLKKFTQGFDGDPRYRHQRWLGAFDAEERAQLFAPSVRSEMHDAVVYEDIDRYLGEVDSSERYDVLSYLYERMYMMDQVLVKVDRASMAHALEVRAPFLDTRVVDLANRMPTSYKLRGTTRKYILKKLMEGKLPHDIIHRRKKGFGMPVGAWLRGELRPLLLETLSPEAVRQVGLFSIDYVERLKDEHLSGTHDHRKKLWTLMVFALWWHKWVK